MGWFGGPSHGQHRYSAQRDPNLKVRKVALLTRDEQTGPEEGPGDTETET